MWHYKNFKELSTIELEQIFRLRQSIFIVEQKSYFNDIDGNDYDAFHLYQEENGEIWAYTRIHNYDNIVKFSRVTVKKEHRGMVTVECS